MRRSLGLVVAAAVLVAGCGSSDYDYVKNADADLYFKLPSKWAQYDEFDIVSLPTVRLQPLQRRRLLARTWMRGFDASAKPSPLHVLDLNGPSPRGRAEVRQLTEDEREAINLSGLRSLPLAQGDPIEVMEQDPDGPVEVLNYEDVTYPGGYHGVRLLVAADANATEVVVVDYTAVVDAKTERLYTFVIGCEERCYLANRSQIDEIADSWIIKER